MLYFAYGSNMLSLRLQRRVASAEPLGRAFLAGHRLRFDKRSWSDASGKARPEATGEDRDLLWGVVYRMAEQDLPALDRVEGLGNGYRRGEAQVVGDGGEIQRVFLYRAQRSHLEADLRPFAWYRDLAIAGACEHRLPPDHVRRLLRVPTMADPEIERRRAGQEILAAAGWSREEFEKFFRSG